VVDVFVWGGVFVLFVFCVVFFVWDYLTLALFWRRFGLLEFVVGRLWALTLWGTYPGGAWLSDQPERGGGVFCVWLLIIRFFLEKAQNSEPTQVCSANYQCKYTQRATAEKE